MGKINYVLLGTSDDDDETYMPSLLGENVKNKIKLSQRKNQVFETHMHKRSSLIINTLQ